MTAQAIDILTGRPIGDGFTKARAQAERVRHLGACRYCWGDFRGRTPSGLVVYVPHVEQCPVRVRERRLEAAAERRAALGFGHAFGDCPAECGCQDADGGAVELRGPGPAPTESRSLVEQSNAHEHRYLGGGPE